MKERMNEDKHTGDIELGVASGSQAPHSGGTTLSSTLFNLVPLLRLHGSTKDQGKVVAGLTDLPLTVLVSKVLICLEARDLVRVGSTCRYLRIAADDSRLWKRLLFLDFAGPRLKGWDEFSAQDDFASRRRTGSNGSGAVSHHANSSVDDDGEDDNSSNVQPEELQQVPSATDVEDMVYIRGLSTNSGYGCNNNNNNNNSWRFVERTNSCGDIGSGSGNTAKIFYLQRVREFEERIRIAAIEVELTKKIFALEKKRAKIERWIRILCLEFTTPLLGICPLITCVLAALQMDGDLPFNAWVILSPTLLLLCIWGISICIGSVLLHYKSDARSILYGMYDNFRGFVQFWMHKVLRENTLALVSGMMLYLLLFIFVLLIGFRLQGQEPFVPVTTSKLEWIFVFIPFWLILIIFALSPVFKWGGADEDMDSFKEPYIVLMFSIWLPVVAFSVVLPLFLDGYIVGNIMLVLIPLWVLEAEFLVFPLLTLAQSLYTRKDISDSVLVVFVVLFIFTPLVTFEILISLKLNGSQDQQTGLTWVKVFSPLFVWFSLCTLTLLNFLFQYQRQAPAPLSSSHPLNVQKANLGYSLRRNSSTRRLSSRSNSGNFRNGRIFRGPADDNMYDLFGAAPASSVVNPQFRWTNPSSALSTDIPTRPVTDVAII